MFKVNILEYREIQESFLVNKILKNTFDMMSYGSSLYKEKFAIYLFMLDSSFFQV